MDSQQSRKIILDKIKGIMDQGRDFPIPDHDTSSDVFPKPENLLTTFNDELTSIGGNVIVFYSKQDLIEQLTKVCLDKNVTSVYCLDPDIKQELKDSSLVVEFADESFKDMQLAITRCECLVSRTGTVVVSSQHPSGRRLNVFPPIHIVLAKESQLVSFPDDALLALDKKYGKDFPSLVSFITGASRTADIEKTLVMGAHGPKEIYVFIEKNA